MGGWIDFAPECHLRARLLLGDMDGGVGAGADKCVGIIPCHHTVNERRRSLIRRSARGSKGGAAGGVAAVAVPRGQWRQAA